MGLTLAEAVKELENLKHARAVWMETVEHLSKFIDQEVKVAEHGIVAEGCVESPVPQPVVREFIDYINDKEIDPLNEKIELLEALSVQETNNDEPDPESKKDDDGKEAAKEEKPGPKAAPARRKIRSLGKPARKPKPKVQSTG